MLPRFFGVDRPITGEREKGLIGIGILVIE